MGLNKRYYRLRFYDRRPGWKRFFDAVIAGGPMGAGLLLREPNLLWKALVVKDPSELDLRLDMTILFLGVAALVSLGFGASATGIYFSASFVDTSGLPISVFIQCIRESLACLIVSSALAFLVLLFHFFTKKFLLAWRVPQSLIG